MPEIRWILLVLGALLIAGIWWWGTRRSRDRDEALRADAGGAHTGSGPMGSGHISGGHSGGHMGGGHMGNSSHGSGAHSAPLTSAPIASTAVHSMSAAPTRETRLAPLEPLKISTSDSEYEDTDYGIPVMANDDFEPPSRSNIQTRPDAHSDVDENADADEHADADENADAHEHDPMPPRGLMEASLHHERTEPDLPAFASTPSGAVSSGLTPASGLAPAADNAQIFNAAPAFDFEPVPTAEPAAATASARPPSAVASSAPPSRAASSSAGPSDVEASAAPSGATPETATAKAARTDTSGRFSRVSRPASKPVERQKIIGLRICSLVESPWPGNDLADQLTALSLDHGRYGIFHRVNGDGRSVFCVASLIEPGTFDLARMPDTLFSGVTLFAVLPGPTDGTETFNQMLAAGRHLIESLGGMMQDDRAAPLSPQRVGSIRDEILQFERQLGEQLQG